METTFKDLNLSNVNHEKVVNNTGEVSPVTTLSIMINNKQDKLDDNDLRILMPSIFGGDVKSFKKGYIMMQCPFHNDSNPSMVVTKDYYYCKSDSCGAKGNWWTLQKLGYVDLPKEEFIRIKDKKIVKI